MRLIAGGLNASCSSWEGAESDLWPRAAISARACGSYACSHRLGLFGRASFLMVPSAFSVSPQLFIAIVVSSRDQHRFCLVGSRRRARAPPARPEPRYTRLCAGARSHMADHLARAGRRRLAGTSPAAAAAAAPSDGVRKPGRKPATSVLCQVCEREGESMLLRAAGWESHSIGQTLLKQHTATLPCCAGGGVRRRAAAARGRRHPRLLQPLPHLQAALHRRAAGH